MSTPGVLPPLSALRIKNCLEGQGLAISSMLATPGEASVACGSRVLGSGAGVGTSICGWSATRGSVCLGWSAERGHARDLRHVRLEAVRWGLIGHKGSALPLYWKPGRYSKREESQC